MPRLPPAGGRGDSTPQCRLLRGVLSAPLPATGRPHHRGLRHDPPRRAGPGGRLGRQGLPGAVGPPPRRRRRRRRALSGARHRGVQRGIRALCAGLRGPKGGPAHRGGPAHPLRLRHTHRCDRGPAGALLGVRAVEAASLQPGCSRRRLRRHRHRPQPRRRGRGPVRQRPALGPRLPGPPVPRPAREPRLRPQGQAVGPSGRAGDGRLLRVAGHRLHRGGVPHGGREPSPRLQGGPQRHRGHLSGVQGRLLFRLSGKSRPVGATGAPRHERAGLHPCPGCGSPTVSEICAFCRLVQRAGGTRQAGP